MYNVSIQERGGETKRMEFDKPEVTIGRVQGNDIILPKGNISKRHSRIVLKDGRFVIVDLKSTNGTYVNGRRITSPLVIKGGDKVYIGDFILTIEEGAGSAAAPSDGAAVAEAPKPATAAASTSNDRGSAARSSVPPPVPQASQAAPAREPVKPFALDEEPPEAPRQRPPSNRPAASASPAAKPQNSPAGPSPARSPAPGQAPPRAAAAQSYASRPGAARKIDPARQKYASLLHEVHNRLIQFMDLRRLEIDKLGDEELRNRTDKSVREIVGQMESEGKIGSTTDKETLIADVLNEALGLGPLEELLADPSITEIMVNNADQIYVERSGKIELTEKSFSSDKAVLGVIERIVAPIGRRIDESSPLVDARLKDGSRVNAIIPPLALKGPTITIRKFRREVLGPDQLVGFGSVSKGMMEFLRMCVTARKNIIISGGTGSGKTTLLNILSNYIPADDRIVTIEDAAELQLQQDHVVSLESRPANIEGKGAIAIRDLVRNSLRMRPDRIVVGECRGGEALDMLQAMNTGHDGSLTTLHANTPRDALSRLETLVLMAGMDLPVKAIRDQIAAAVDIIVQQSRMGDGSRKVTAIEEVTGMEGEIITTQRIFEFKQESLDDKGKIVGKYLASGFVPRFYEDLQSRGLPVNMAIFRE